MKFVRKDNDCCFWYLVYHCIINKNTNSVDETVNWYEIDESGHQGLPVHFSLYFFLFHFKVAWFIFSQSIVTIFVPIFVNTGSYVAHSVSRFRAWNVIERHSTARFQPSPLKHCTKGTGKTSIFHQRQNKRLLVNAAAGQPLESEPPAYTPKSVGNSAKDALDAFYRFSRPHTVIGTVSFKFNRASPI